MGNESMLDSLFIHSSMEIVHADPVFCTLMGIESQEELHLG